LLLYTDGVTEGRAADGTPFGTERLADFIIRHSSTGLLDDLVGDPASISRTRRRSFLCRRTWIRSSGVVPPQMPSVSPVS